MQKLKFAVRHAHWDLITEYDFLPIALCEPLSTDTVDGKVEEVVTDSESKKLNPFELGKLTFNQSSIKNEVK